MQAAAIITLALVSAPHVGAISPLGQVMNMLSELSEKILRDGEETQRAHEKFADWCKERQTNVNHEITTGSNAVAQLEGSIDNEKTVASELAARIEDSTNKVAGAEADLKAATAVRDTEKADFEKETAELEEIIDTLTNAIRIIESEMRKGGAAMVQLKHAGNVAQALTALVQAAVFSSADATRLTALVQSFQQSESDSDDGDAGAPAAAVYKSQSGGVLDALQNLLDKAESQLSDGQKSEKNRQHNFDVLAQSLVDEAKFGKKDVADSKNALASSNAKRSGAEGELASASNSLAEDQDTAVDLRQSCESRMADYEAEKKSRANELLAINEAERVLRQKTGEADERVYGLNQVSLLQLGATGTSVDAVRFVRELAKRQHAPELAQLANQMGAMVRSGARLGSDPFAKVKGLIVDMITKLESAASADATKKAFCDEELSENGAKKADLSARVDALTVRIDASTAKSAQLKEEAKALQQELAELAASQATMDQLRQSEHAAFLKEKADLENGLEGTRTALKALRDYFGQAHEAHEASDGEGNSIINILEVIESDLSKALFDAESTENGAVSAYKKDSRDNELEKAAKGKDVEYKTKSAAGTDKSVSEDNADRDGLDDQLQAVLGVLDNLKKQCIAKAETYADRASQRAAEIAGLKEALQILNAQTAFVQQTSLRGVRKHALA